MSVQISMRAMQPMPVVDWGRLWLNEPSQKRPRNKRQRRKHEALRRAVALLKRAEWLAPYESTRTVPVETVTFDLGKIGQQVRAQAYGLRRSYDLREVVVLLGPYEAQGLMGEVQYPMCVRVPMMPGEAAQYAGMTLCVLPWMQGILLVPKEYFPVTIKEVVRTETAKERAERKAREEGERAAAMWNDFLGRGA